tara:strand:+ start:4326 stop:4721 length:396 start_codon:yes stop_codon:yes gene_type:complete
MSVQAAVERSVAKKQRGVRVQAGDRFLRGLRYVIVQAVRDGGVEYLDLLSNEKRTSILSDFRGRVLYRVKPVGGIGDDVVRLIWDIASTRLAPFDLRVTMVNRLIKAVRPEDMDKITKWVSQLKSKEEPRR